MKPWARGQLRLEESMLAKATWRGGRPDQAACLTVVLFPVLRHFDEHLDEAPRLEHARGKGADEGLLYSATCLLVNKFVQ